MVASPSAALFMAAQRLAFFVQLKNLVGNLLPRAPLFRSLAIIGGQPHPGRLHADRPE